MSKLAILGGKPVGVLNTPKWPIYDEKEITILNEVLESGIWAFLGPKEKTFEKKFAEFCGTKYAVASSNVTHIIRMAFEALNIGPGDEVIVPGSTWQATAAAALDVNAIPILVDVEPRTYTIDPKQIEKAITSRTKCIVPVHLYCRVCDMDAIMSLASKYNLHVIEDCSHQHGSEWRGKKVGGIGDIGTFSLQASKILNTGEGGILTTNDYNIYKTLQSLKNCGRPVGEDGVSMQSGNYRMTEFQSAIGITQLERLAAQNKLRNENALYLEDKLNNIEGISTLYRDNRITSQSYYQLTIRYNRSKWRNIHRDIFMKALQSELENSLSMHTPYQPLNDSPLYRPFSKKTHKLSDEYMSLINPERFKLPECDKAYFEEVINFWHPVLLSSKKELDKIVKAISKIRANIDELYEEIPNMNI